jgi:hypothetical protein
MAEEKDSTGGNGKPKRKRPARGYSWAPLQPGHELKLTHGAGGRGHLPTSRISWEVANNIAATLMASPDCPSQLHMPQFAAQVQSWSRLEAKVKLLHNYLETMTAEDQITPRKAGGETPMSVYLAAERAAERARDKLGLTPASWAKIQKDLGIAEMGQAHRLAEMGAKGAAIRQRVQAEMRVIRGDAEDG